MFITRSLFLRDNVLNQYFQLRERVVTKREIDRVLNLAGIN